MISPPLCVTQLAPLLLCAAMSCNSKSNGARCYGRAALASIMKDDGWPYASLVMIACDAAANP